MLIRIRTRGNKNVGKRVKPRLTEKKNMLALIG